YSAADVYFLSPISSGFGHSSHGGEGSMLPLRRSQPSYSRLGSFALASLLLLTARGFAAVSATPDVPSPQAAPEPRTIDEEIRLATDYFVGRGVTQDAKQAAYWYRKAAEAGDPEAQLETGYLYAAGIGGEKNPALAVHWYQLAVAGGLARAKVNLAVAYLWGNGVEKNQGEAMRLLEEAAGKGVGRAAGYLGVLYQFGIGVPADSARADWWYGKGVKLHDPQAEFDLGTLESLGANHA